MSVQAQPNTTFAGYTQLEVQVCESCGIMYALPEEMLNRARKNPDIWWYCPNGHHWHFLVKSLEQQLKEQKDRAARERALRDQAEASNRALRGVVTRKTREHARVVERVSNGVCPCCDRSFQNLARHMKSKHPDYEA